MQYRSMSGYGLGAIDNPIDIPGSANYPSSGDVAPQIPSGVQQNGNAVDLSSAFYYMTGGTPPAATQTPAGQNPNIVNTLGSFQNYIAQNPLTSFLFALLILVMVGNMSNPGPKR